MTYRSFASQRGEHLRRCFYCDGKLEVRYPVWLIQSPDKRIVGPFHAECAKLVVAAGREIQARGLEPGINFSRILLHAREETLPW